MDRQRAFDDQDGFVITDRPGDARAGHAGVTRAKLHPVAFIAENGDLSLIAVFKARREGQVGAALNAGRGFGHGDLLV